MKQLKNTFETLFSFFKKLVMLKKLGLTIVQQC